jgi:hypothetical protein
MEKGSPATLLIEFEAPCFTDQIFNISAFLTECGHRHEYERKDKQHITAQRVK